jgi:hypothetical protein
MIHSYIRRNKVRGKTKGKGKGRAEIRQEVEGEGERFGFSQVSSQRMIGRLCAN